jgi:hypothetical protein
MPRKTKKARREENAQHTAQRRPMMPGRSRWRALSWALSVVFLLGGVGAGAAQARPSEHPFELVPGSFRMSMSTGQAAAHEDLTTTFDFAHDAKSETYNDFRSTVVNLPAGFVASNTAVPRCSFHQLNGAPSINGVVIPPCPPASTVGTISFDFGTNGHGAIRRLTVPVYLMETTSFGVTAQLGFAVLTTTQFLNVSVRPGDDGLTVSAPDIENLGEPRDISVTIWGVPASHEHDLERQQTCDTTRPEGESCRNERGGPEPAGVPAKPLLSNPTGCEPHVATIEAYSWEEPANHSRASFELPPISECERVPFAPSIEVQPSTRSADSASGVEVTLAVPQTWDTPDTIATANLKDATVTLPAGFTVNPSAGSGLGACTPQQFQAETSSSLPGDGCPAESKIGSIEITTPLLAEKIPGAIYIATPYENPAGSLLALYVVAKDPERGVIVKVAGKIEPDPVTGQLSTTFLNNPQQPFSRFTLKFRPGATAPLVSPPACGAYSTQAALTPWSAPLEPRLIASTPFEITQGVHEGPCPSGGVPPFKPLLVAGTQNNAAGSYSPFYLHLTREDGEQELTRFSTVMPPGLTGNLTGIPFCPDAAVAAAKARTGPHGGAEELAAPSCPAASRIGHTIVGAGVGTVLAQTPGSLYLAGPYHGAPLSLVSITSATVGPFDLGTVVIRFALHINPTTAQVEVDAAGSDPIPHIIKGIVVHVRDIRAYIDRANFILNPTSCEHLQIANVVTGAGADPANPADQVPVNVTSAFQAANCQNLAFKPLFQASTSGKTSRANGASLTVKLTYPNAPQGSQANIARVKVDLPKQLPSRLTTLQKACTAAQFNTNPAGCPAASFIGHAKAVTPILPVPLEGPAIFVSHGGEAFPSLEIVLQGYGITIDLVGSTFISKSGITSSTFKTVPDQPVTSFELTLPEGKFSALAANGNLCASTKAVTVSKRVTRRIHGRTRRVTVKVKKSVAAPLAMPTEFVAQNGAVLKQNTKIAVTGCAKKVVKHKAKGKRKGKGGKKK